MNKINIQYDRIIVNPLGNTKKVHNKKFYTLLNLFKKKNYNIIEYTCSQ